MRLVGQVFVPSFIDEGEDAEAGIPSLLPTEASDSKSHSSGSTCRFPAWFS